MNTPESEGAKCPTCDGSGDHCPDINCEASCEACKGSGRQRAEQVTDERLAYHIEPSFPPHVDQFDIVDSTGATLVWRLTAEQAQAINDALQHRSQPGEREALSADLT